MSKVPAVPVALCWMMLFGRELFQKLAEEGHAEILAGFCADEARDKLVFDALQSAGDTKMYGQLIKLIANGKLLEHLEKKLPNDPYLRPALKEHIDARRAELKASLPEIPNSRAASDTPSADLGRRKDDQRRDIA